MADGKVVIDTQLNASGAQNGITKLKKGLTGIGSVAKTGLGVATKAIGAAGAAVTAFGVSAIKTATEFDSAMSKVQAISGASEKDIAKLRDRALDVAQTSIFTSKQTADAMSYMAMAGWKTKEIYEGIPSILHLAAASGEDLATTSDIVTDALTAFGLSAKDSGHFADVLAQASTNANTNVGLMGETFKYVAPVAGALGINAEDIAISVGLMANASIKASQAGTQLRTGLANMAKPTKQMQEYMDRYNISLSTNADGSVNLRDTMIDLREKMGSLDKTEQTAAASAIFGKEAMAGWLAIINASDENFNSLAKSIDNSDGAAENMSKTMKKNLKGSLKDFTSALDIFKVRLSDLAVGIRGSELGGFIDAGSEIIRKMNEGLEKGDVSVLKSGLAEIINLAISGIADSAPMVIDAGMELIGFLVSGITENGEKISDGINEIIRNIGGKISENTEPFINGLTDMLTKSIDFVADNLPDMVNFAVDLIKKIGSSLIEHAPELATSVQRLITSAFSSVGDAVPVLKPVTDMLQTLVKNIDIVIAVLAPFAAAWVAVKVATIAATAPMVAYQAVAKAVTAVQLALNAAMSANPIGLVILAITALVAAFVVLWNRSEEFRNFWINLWDKIVDVAQDVWKKISDTFQSAWSAISKIWGKAVTFFSPIFEAIAGAAKAGFEMIRSIATTVFSAVKKVVKTVQPVFETVFSTIQSVATTVFGAIRSFVTTAINAIITVAKPVGTLVSTPFRLAWSLIKTAWKAARAYFVGIFDGIKGIFSAISKIWKGDFSGAWQDIKGVFKNAGQTFLNIGKEIINGLTNGVKDAAGKAVEAVKDVAGNIISGAKSVLGIHSPSRVFKEIGQYTMKGFEIGLVDASGNIIKKVAKTFSEVIKQAEDTAEESIKHYEDLVKAYNDTAEQINKNNTKRKEILKKQAEEEAELKLKANRKLKDLEKDLHSENEKTRKSAAEKAKKIQTELARAIADNKKKSNKEIGELEKEQTKLLKQAEKEKTAVKKAEEKARLDSSKAYYSDETKELLNYYDELNKAPTLLEQVKGLQETVENLKEVRENYEAELDNINTTEQTKMQEMLDDYVDKWQKTRETWDSNLAKLKTDYETDMQSIVDAQNKYSSQLADFVGLFGAVKAEDIIDADTILTNAAEQTTKVEKYYQDMEKLTSMNLPQEIVDELRDMGVGAADQLEVFVNMSSAQLDQFVNEWNKRKEISDKLAEKYYSSQKTQREQKYTEEKAAMEQQAQAELDLMRKDYEDKVKLETDQWRQNLKSAEENYNNLTKQITDSYNKMFGAEMSNYINSMQTLKAEASKQATQIGNAVKTAIERGSYVSTSEAQRIANQITAPILECVRANLEIHSPSRVFAEIGDLCIQGFEQPFENYNPTDLMKPSVNSVLNSVNRSNSQSQQITNNNNTTNAPVMNFYDSAVSPDAVMRQYNRTMRYGLAGGMA